MEQYYTWKGVCSNGHEFSLDYELASFPSIPSEIPTNATTVSGIIIQTFNLPFTYYINIHITRHSIHKYYSLIKTLNTHTHTHPEVYTRFNHFTKSLSHESITILLKQ